MQFFHWNFHAMAVDTNLMLSITRVVHTRLSQFSNRLASKRHTFRAISALALHKGKAKIDQRAFLVSLAGCHDMAECRFSRESPVAAIMQILPRF